MNSGNQNKESDGTQADQSRPLQINVVLPSGKRKALSVPCNATVAELRVTAQQALGQLSLKLVASDGRLLQNQNERLEAARLRDGDDVTAVVQKPMIAASSQAFALWTFGAEMIVTWGNPSCGGNATMTFGTVHQVQATSAAFAAVLTDGMVATWGHQTYGGDNILVEDQLINVQQIQSTHAAFAAIKSDGSVVTWGLENYGGDSSRVQGKLKNVQQIQSSHSSFAAILADDKIVTWGKYYGILENVNVQQIQSTQHAFAAILADGTVLTWGPHEYGGNSKEVRDQLINVKHIQATHRTENSRLPPRGLCGLLLLVLAGVVVRKFGRKI